MTTEYDFFVGGAASVGVRYGGDVPAATVVDYPTRAALQAKNIRTEVLHVITAGYDDPSDKGGGLYIKVASEPSHAGKIRAANGIWFELFAFEARPEQFGANNDNDASAVQDWLDYLVATGCPGRAPGQYKLEAVCTLSDPDNVHINAKGSTWTVTYDGLGLDLNGRADCTYQENESRQNFTWIGGEFGCSAGTPTKTAAIRLLGMRQAYLSPDKVDGFVTGLILGGKDTVLVENVKFFNNEIDIEFPPWSTSGGPLEFHLKNLHHSHGGKSDPCIKSYVQLSDSVIWGCSFNLGSGATCIAVDLTKYVLIPITGSSGAWSVGETVTGFSSGATMVLEEVYDHGNAFSLAGQPTRYLVGKTLTGAFTASELVTGGTSGATGTTVNHANGITNGTSWTDLKIEGPNHFEAGSGAAGATGIRIRDLVGTGGATWMINIDVGKCNLSEGSSVGVEFQNVQNSTVCGYFSMENGGTDKCLKLDSSCSNIAIPRPFHSPHGTIDLNGMSRDELDLSTFDVLYDDPQDISIGGTLASGATAATSSAVSAAIKTDIGGLYPKSYGLRMSLNMPSAGSVVRLRAFKTGVTSAAAKDALQIGGLSASQWYWHNSRVAATDGEFEWDAQNTGGGSVSYSIDVTSKHY